MKNPLISVIVPVYKVEKYLRQCVDSIRNQTYSNLEILLIDDGSPDDCPKICDFYSSIDPRIRTIHQANKGLSGARNTGLRNARGEYVAFVDSDDWLEPNCYKKCVDVIDETSADIVCYDIYEVRGEDVLATPHMPRFSEKNQSTFRSLDKLGLLFSLWPLVWAKVYRRSWLEDQGMFFIEGILYEDNPFVLGCWIRNPVVSILPEYIHYYRMQRPGQISSVGQTKSDDVFIMMREVEKDFKAQNREKDFLLLIDWSVGNILWLYGRTPATLQKSFYLKMQKCFLHYCFLCIKGMHFPKKETLNNMLSVILRKSLR